MEPGSNTDGKAKRARRRRPGAGDPAQAVPQPDPGGLAGGGGGGEVQAAGGEAAQSLAGGDGGGGGDGGTRMGPIPATCNGDPSLQLYPAEVRSLLDDPDKLGKLALALVSPAYHFGGFVKVRNLSNELIRPVPNVLQLRLSAAYETMRARGARVRIVCVKPRQVGCSSFSSHILYHHSRRWACEGLTISDVAEHSGALMEKLVEYTKHDEFPWGIRLERDVAQGLKWSNGTRWELDSAENPKAGIGGTRQLFHASEVSKWPKTAIKNDRRTMGAVLPSLNSRDSVVIAESTPEGATGWFYDTYRSALTLEEFCALDDEGRAPEECWVKVFAAWHEFEQHRRARPCTEAEIEHMRRSLTKRESDGMGKWGWSWEQLAWRRDTMAAKCNGSELLFLEYYPEDEESCFTASGRPRFEMERILEMERGAAAMVAEYGHLSMQSGGGVGYSVRWDGGGDIICWERPVRGRRYLVACDPATGASQTTGSDPDRTSVQVWRARYFDDRLGIERPASLVARVRSPFFGDADEVAGHIHRLSRWYGNALVVLEINQGLHILELLKAAGVPLYKRIVPAARVTSLTEMYGFKLTDAEQRRGVIEALAAAIRNGEVEVSCSDWLREAKHFVVKPSGRAEAASGEHDDDVMCLPAGRMVRTSDGWKPIERIKSGDLVLTHQGRFMPVGMTSSNEVDETVEIDVFGRVPLEITGNHSILVRKRRHRSWRDSGVKKFSLCHMGLEWRSAIDGLDGYASVGGWCRTEVPLETLEMNEFGSYEKRGGMLVPMTYCGTRRNPKGVAMDASVDIDGDFCWILGYYYAEGGHGAHTVAFSAHEREMDYLDRVREWFIGRGCRPSIRKISEHGKQLSFGSMVWRKWFRDNFGVGRAKKFPEWVVLLPRELQRSVIAGWACGDACFTANGLRGATISHVGALQLWEMFCRCGYAASIRKVKQGDCYCIGLSGPQTKRFIDSEMSGLMGCRLSAFNPSARNQGMIRFLDNEILGKIRSVEKTEGRKMVYNLTVLGDSSYVVEGTVVHNCGAMAWFTLPSAGEFRRLVSREQAPPDRSTWKRVSNIWRGW